MDVLAALSALAQIATLAIQIGVPLRSDGRPDFAAAIGDLTDLLTPSQRDALRIGGADEIVTLLIISPDLLDDLEREVEKCLATYRKGLSGGTFGDRSVADNRAERCVCENLNRIRRRNGGRLPDGQFDDWWESYRCRDDWDH